MTKHCVDCKHYQANGPSAPFSHPMGFCKVMMGKPSPIDGKSIDLIEIATVMRLTLCGWDFPRFWVDKDKK